MAQDDDSAVDTGGADLDLGQGSVAVEVADAARPPAEFTFGSEQTAPTVEAAYEADTFGGLLFAECLMAPDAFLMSEAMLFEQSFAFSSESEPGFLRGMCVPFLDLVDFTEPVLTPRNRDGELPITMNLNLFGDTYMTAQRRYWDRNVDGSVSWIGVLKGPAVNANGEVLITVRNGVWAMTARLGTKMWDLRGVDSECGYRLEEWDEALLAPSPPAVGVEGPASPATAYVPQVQDIEYGVMPKHPDEQIPTLDILMVGTADGRGGFVNEDAYIAYGHNRVHEVDLTFLRTYAHRTHRPRLVGYYFEPSVLPGVPVDIPVLQGSAGLDAERNAKGADVVIAIGPTAGAVGAPIRWSSVDGRMDWRPGLSDNANEPVGANWDNEGYLAVSADSNYTADWYFTRALGIVIGGMTESTAYQTDQLGNPNTNWNGTSGFSESVNYDGIPLDNTFVVSDLLGDISPRTPVFGGVPFKDGPLYAGGPTAPATLVRWGYAPRVTYDYNLDYDPALNGVQRNPWYDRLDLDLYGRDRYDSTIAALWYRNMRAIAGHQGIRLGDTRIQGGLNYLSCLGSIAFDSLGADLTPWSEDDTGQVATDGSSYWDRCVIAGGEHSAVESVAYYKESKVESFSWQLASVLSAQIVNGQLVMTFDQTKYASGLLSPPPPLPPPAPCTDLTEATCSLDSNPYFIELGTSFGNSSAVETWVGASACSGGICTVSGPSTNLVATDEIFPPPPGAVPASLGPATLYYGRLWSQISANSWGYVEFRVNNALPSVVACNSEDPSFVSPQHALTGCAPGVASVIASSVVFPGTPALQVSLDPTGAGVSSALADVLPSTPPVGNAMYDGAVVGTTADGVDFCCLFAEPASPSYGIEVLGGKQADKIQFSFGGQGVPFSGAGVAHIAATGGWGNDSISVNCEEEGPIYVSGAIGDDTIWIEGECYGTINGDAHNDNMLAYDIRKMASGNPAHKLVLNGLGGTDIMQATASDLSSTPPPVELYGGGGSGNTLCTDHGGVLMKGSSPNAGASFLYVSAAATAAVPYYINPNTRTGTAGSQCGASIHNTNLPGWAGPQCLYGPAVVKPAVCDLVAN